jgi:phosphohistidine phosphatase
MRRLMLLRHGKSDWPAGVPDERRPLAERGRSASKTMAQHMIDCGLLPDHVLVSPAVRTLQTWEIVGTKLATATVVPEADMRPAIYEADAAQVLAEVRTVPEDKHSVLLVGHNPGLEDLTRLLCHGGDALALSRIKVKFPTAALAVIDLGSSHWSEVGEGSGQLARFDTPRSITDAAKS